MRVVFALVVSILLNIDTPYAQESPNDRGVTDTLVLKMSASPAEGSRSAVTVEVWVYSDDTILSFNAGFTWDNQNLYLDSAVASTLFDNPEYHIFLLHQDNLESSNLNRAFVLAGFSSGAGLSGDLHSRRLWATYYFTVENWHNGDSLSINVLPDSQIELAFVSPGPFYPLKYKPHFGGPMLFPGIATSLEEIDDATTLPNAVVLYQNYPNPFNPQTTIEFEILRSGHTLVEIFNTLGQRIATLVNKELSTGLYRFDWNGENENGHKAQSGVYFYKLQTPYFVTSRKMILIR